MLGGRNQQASRPPSFMYGHMNEKQKRMKNRLYTFAANICSKLSLSIILANPAPSELGGIMLA